MVEARPQFLKTPPGWIPKLTNVEIIVIGDVRLDHFVYGEVSRISRDGPCACPEIRESEVHPWRRQQYCAQPRSGAEALCYFECR